MFIISLPFTGAGWAFRMGFYFQLNYLFFMLLVISFFYNKFSNRDYSFAITPIDAPLFMFLLVATVSVFQTIYVSNNPTILYDSFRNYPWIKGFIGVIFLLFMFIVYYITINLVSNKKMFKKTLFLLIITAVIVSLYGLIGFFFTSATSLNFPYSISPLTITHSLDLRIKSVFSEPLFLGSYILSMLPVLYCLFISETKYFSKRFLITGLSILSLTLILTVSKGALFGFFVFLFLFIVVYFREVYRYAEKVYKKIFKNLLKGLFIALLLLTLLLLVDSVIFEMGFGEKIEIISEYSPKYAARTTITVSERTIKSLTETFNPSAGKFWSVRLRLLAIHYAWEGFKEHPLIGVGYSNYGFYSGSKVYEGLNIISMNFPEVNNYPLKVLAETGLIGFIIFIWLFTKIIKSAISVIVHEKNNTKKALATGYLFSFIAISVQLMFFSYITMAYFWVMLAMMMSLYRTDVINLKRI